MTPDRWKAVESIFDEAADLAPPDRPAFLDLACRTPAGAPDPGLREEVERLLTLDVGAERFLDRLRDDLSPGGAAPAPPDANSAPPDAGPWRLVERVGEGGMGEVWRAERSDGAYAKTAAVKLVRPGLGAGLAARFRAERHLLARLDHPAIARLLDGGTASDGRPYLALEYVDGEPITAYADRRRLGVNERIALFQEVCEAVAAAHRRLVVHRDIKPSNVLVTGDGRVKLLDFGIAKFLDNEAGFTVALTAAGHRLMTPEYAAPEQIRGEPATTATDVYGLGVLLYELLTGTRPYRLESHARQAVERAILEAPPTDPSTAVTGADEAAAARATEPVKLRRRLRGDLDQIVLRALRKDPDRRYGGAAALAADLGRHLEGVPVEARPESVGYRAGRFVRRHRVGVATAVAGLVAVVGGAGLAALQGAEAARQRDRAEAEAATARRVTAFVTDLFRETNSVEANGDTITARDMLDRGLDRARSLDDAPGARADLLVTLGAIYRDLGRFDKADEALADVVALRRAAGDSLGVADAFLQQGFLQSARRDFGAAAGLYRSALAQLAAGPDSTLARARLSLAGALVETGDLEEASALLDAAEPALHRLPDQSAYRAVLTERARVQLRREDPEGALGIYRALIEQLRSLPGPEVERERATTLNNYGYTLRKTEDYAGALAAYQEALEITSRLDREGHRNRSVLLGNIALAASLAGDEEAAEAALRERIDLEVEHREPGHWRIGSAYGALARFYLDAGRADDAVAFYRQQLAVYQSALGPAHDWTAGSHAWLGLASLAAGRPAAADRELAAAERAFRRWLDDGETFGPDSEATLQRVSDRLGEVGRAERSEAFRTIRAEGVGP